MSLMAADPSYSDVKSFIERDVAALASQAAIDIESYIVRGVRRFESVENLIDVLSKNLYLSDTTKSIAEKKYLYDPGMVVAINSAISDSSLESAIKTIDDLEETAREIIDKLSSLVSSPEDHYKPELLPQMRTFCLALSRRASSPKRPIVDLMKAHRKNRMGHAAS